MDMNLITVKKKQKKWQKCKQIAEIYAIISPDSNIVVNMHVCGYVRSHTPANL